MPQIQLPIFPEGVTYITNELAFKKKDGQIIYFNGTMPVFIHEEEDLKTFRMITSQFVINGNVKQSELVKAFGLPGITVKRYVKLYREKGPEGFYEKKGSRGAGVLTPEVLAKVQEMLNGGESIPEIGRKLELKANTLSKALRAGRLEQPVKKELEERSEALVSTKSQRSGEDSSAGMGMGATRTLERVAASLGELNEGPVEFKPSLDVAKGGVLLALPALIVSGLLAHVTNFFQLSKGYYGVGSIFLLLAFMALSRMKAVEWLRYCAPGEWGKILGLDRVPEVRTLRQKIRELSGGEGAEKWSARLCSDWMEGESESAGTFYIDGHVRVYYGKQSDLPRHYIAREKLCHRATTDYWVNAMDSQPFFVINKAIDPGLLQVLREEIVPRLEKENPHQLPEEQFCIDALQHRFTVVFDREGYSPEFFLEMKNKHIACLTYHKYPGEEWPQEEFVPRQVELSNGNTVEMKLAERGVWLSNKLWVREIRKRSESGHQTSVLATDYISDLGPVAMAMFARWSQENFFKYMREHYNLDRLVDYDMEEISDTTRLVNPEYRKLDGQVRSKASILNRKLAQFGALNLEGEIDSKKVGSYQEKKAELQEGISHLQKEVDKLKSERKATKHHITVSELPEEARFSRLSTHSKHLVDTVKMIAYRAETAMAHTLREKMSRSDDARSLLRAIYQTDADILPDEKEGTLTVRLHHLANRSEDGAISYLCDELNATQTVFPGTNLRLVYELVSSQYPRDQVV